MKSAFKPAHLILLPLFLIITTLISCDSTPQRPAPVPGSEREYDISYGGDVRNKLDVYLPGGRDSNTIFVLFIHGGAWISGDKGNMNMFQDSLMKKGIASASMNYRYAGSQVHYPELMQDVSAALHFCHSKHSDWNIRSDKYIVCGYSAGAHMGLLYTYKYDTAHEVSAVISLAGPTDVTQTDWLNYSILSGLSEEINYMAGAVYIPGQPLDPKFADASPRFHIRNIPVLLIHGDDDAVVFYNQSQLLSTDLNNRGIPYKMVTLPGTGHDFRFYNPVSFQSILDEIESWSKTYGR